MQNPKRLRIANAPFYCALFCVAAASISFGQFETATVLGTATDPRAGVIPQARVSLTNLDTGTSQSTLTDDSGNFQFLEVRVGRYRVIAEAAGFKKLETAEFRVDVGARQRVDIRLQVGDVAETVQVTEAAVSVERDSSDRGQVINQEAVVELPLNGRSNASLALLAPGVRLAYGLGKRESSFNVSGLRSQFNNFILDGVDNNAYGTSNQGLSNQVIQVAPDVVQQFKVITNSYSAEYGRVGGAVVNASVRSGTNQHHGAAWEFLRNTDLNAVGFFKPTGGQKPVYIQNQFGGAIGGPIKKDKLFIFADYEGLRRLQKSLSTASVPTLAQRSGVFTVPLVNPYDGSVLPNSTIPASLITKFGATVFNALPAPNLPGNTKNFSALLPSTDTDNKGDIRADYYLSSKVTAFSRYSDRLYYQLAPPNNGTPGASGQGAGIVSRVMNWQTASGITWTVTPTSLLEFRVGASKSEGMKTPATLDGGPSMFDLYGIPGLPTSKELTGGLNTQNVSGYQSYGRDWSSPQWQNPLVINPKVNYSRIRGRHTFKLGYEYQAIDTLINDFNPVYGQDYYAGQYSNPTPTKSNNLYDLADFLLGARSTYQLTNYSVAHLRQRMHFAYLQDDFKVSPKLTLNLGVRYEFATPQYDRDNHMANYDPATNSLVVAKDGSIASRALVNPSYKNFAPRVGLAYSVTPKTVIRSGYGISYVLFERQGGDSYLAYNGPFIVNAQVTQSPSQGLCGANSVLLTCFRPTEMGYPAGFASPANFSTVTTKTVYIQKDIRTPYVQTWHLTVQRELAKDLVLDVGYAGNHSVGLWVTADLNQAYPNLVGQSLPVKARRPNAQFDYIDSNFSAGFSTYHALQAKLEKRFGAGLYVLNSFTWSKAIDNASGALEMGNGDRQSLNYFDFQSSKGLSGYDQPFNDTSTVLWSLPFGRSRKFGSSMPSVLDALAGGWALSGINTMTSGQPINLTYTPGAAFVATDGSKNSAVYQADVTGNPMLPAGERTISRYFNTSNVHVPTDVSHPFGNAGRNTARSNSFYNLDLGVHKQFQLPGESRKLEFRAEVFNALNKTNFQAATGDVASSSFGVISSAMPARQVQFALKLLF
jgi:Carboxypeptidase regulatory-like domain/TonB dependent receptor/TonB-dependent Receptor Plug Domain